MSNNLNITITAADKATKVIRRVNTAMTNSLRPVTQLRRAAHSLGSEMWSSPLTRGLTRVGASAAIAARQIRGVAAPFTAVAGISSVAGVLTLANAWGKAGLQMHQNSRMMGLSAEELQKWRGAAVAAGLGASQMDGALLNLGSTLQDAEYGRDPQALAMLSDLGIKIGRGKNGVVDTAQAMNDIADAIARAGNPQTQAVIAKQFGLSELLPMLQDGSNGLRRYTALAEKLGAVNKKAAASNQQVGESFAILKLAFSGFENRVADSWVGNAINHEILGWANIISGNRLYPDSPGSKLVSRIFHGSAAPKARTQLKSRQVSVGAIRRPAAGIPNLQAQVYEQIHGKPMPIGMRQNNPGNLRLWGGVPSYNGFASFATPRAGLSAMATQLELYNSRGIHTLRGIVSKYAPSSENNTAAYIADVSRRTGFSPDAQLNLADSKTLVPIISAMVRHEQGYQPFSPEMIASAVSSGITNAMARNPAPTTLVKVEAPAGSRVTSRTSDGKNIQIAQSMPAHAS